MCVVSLKPHLTYQFSPPAAKITTERPTTGYTCTCKKIDCFAYDPRLTCTSPSPGTTDGAAFFENNDEILLGRVDKDKILDRDSYMFWNGIMLDGTVAWTSDATIAHPIWSFPQMTSVQQANFHPGIERYIFANW